MKDGKTRSEREREKATDCDSCYGVCADVKAEPLLVYADEQPREMIQQSRNDRGAYAKRCSVTRVRPVRNSLE